jgi:hypothetical protein
MAVVATPKAEGRLFEGDGYKVKAFNLALGTYATDGVAVTPADFGMESIVDIFFPLSDETTIKAAFYKASTGKVIAYKDWAATQADAGAIAAINCLVIGR